MRKSTPLAAAQLSSRAPSVVCKAKAQWTGDEKKSFSALPLATMVAAGLLAGAFTPDEAIAANSSGRAGGSSRGFSARKAAPAAAA